MIRSVGIIGYGQFGAFLHVLVNRFVPDVEVCAYSPDTTPDGRLFRSLETTVQCDVVFLSVPISAYADVLQTIKPLLPATTIVVDVATVKLHTVSTIKAVLPEARYIAVHPMFGPASYSKKGGDVSGFKIALTDSSLQPNELDALKAWMTAHGFMIVELSADQHDQQLAETLFLTHYIAQVLSWGNFERRDIDTVSFGYLMDAVDSVRDDTKLFIDVNRFNPYCRDVVRRFDECENAVKQTYLILQPAAES